MGLSESTLHWLVDGEKAGRAARAGCRLRRPHYDPSAAVAGRKRTVVEIGGAAIVAFVVAVVLHGQASRHRTAPEAPQEAAEPAAVLTQRAEAALVHGRSGEAMDLAHLAIVTDPDARRTPTSSSGRSSATAGGSQKRATPFASISSSRRLARTPKRRAPALAALPP